MMYTVPTMHGSLQIQLLMFWLTFSLLLILLLAEEIFFPKSMQVKQLNTTSFPISLLASSIAHSPITLNVFKSM